MRDELAGPPERPSDATMIFTIPVLLYQLLFVLILYIANRFGRRLNCPRPV